jgi:hypothetical protein
MSAILEKESADQDRKVEGLKRYLAGSTKIVAPEQEI